jgi:hypothetical protein
MVFFPAAGAAPGGLLQAPRHVTIVNHMSTFQTIAFH